MIGSTALAFGIVCRVLAFVLSDGESSGSDSSSSGFGNESITISLNFEFSTPHFVSPNGILFCDTSTSSTIDFSTTRVINIYAGGSQFDTSATIPIDLQSNAFLSNEIEIDNLESGVISDFLSRDSHYSYSYSFERYDELNSAFPGLANRRTSLESDIIDNCLLISGKWIANKRYQIILNASIPLQTSTSIGPFWIAPLTYTAKDENLGTPTTISVRGDKLGTSCPIVTHDQYLIHQNGTCPNGYKQSSRRNSECIQCPNESPINCSCPENRFQLSVGKQACGPLIGANSINLLASKLCKLFSEQLDKLKNGTASDSVSVTYMEQLIDIGSSFIDAYLAEESQSIYEKNYKATDSRRLNSPTRKFGLLPNCGECDGNGEFVDTRTGTKGILKDRRLQSIHSLRAVGLALQKSGLLPGDGKCATLFDESTVLQSFEPFVKRHSFWHWRDL